MSISDFEWWVKEGLLGIGQQSATTAVFSAPSDDTEIRYTGPRYADDFMTIPISNCQPDINNSSKEILRVEFF